MDNDKRKIELDLHEMGKSFARDADDEDMNEKLKVVSLNYKHYYRKCLTSSGNAIF